MNITVVIIISILLLSLMAPFIALYSTSYIRKNKYIVHMKIQIRLFWTCVIGVLILEVQIRLSGGSGSLVANSQYIQTSFFKYILTAHIIGAVLTYLLWAGTIFWSSKTFRERKLLPIASATVHRKLGYIIIGGLFYTSVTAFIVCGLAFSI